MSVSTEEVADAFNKMAKVFSSMEKISTFFSSKNGNGNGLTDADISTIQRAVESFTNDLYEISEVIQLKTICQIFKSMKKSKEGNQNRREVKLTTGSSQGNNAPILLGALGESSSLNASKEDNASDHRPFSVKSSDDHKIVQAFEDEGRKVSAVKSDMEGSKPIPAMKPVLFSEQSAFIKPEPRVSTEQPRPTISSHTVTSKTTSPFNISQKKFECIKPEPYTFPGSSKASVSTRSTARSTKHEIIKPVPYTYTKGLKTPVIAEQTTSIESLQQNFEPIKAHKRHRGTERSQRGGRRGSRTKSSPLETVQKVRSPNVLMRNRGSRRRGRRGRRRYANVMDCEVETTEVSMEVDEEIEQDDLLNTINKTINEINLEENSSMLLDEQFLLDNLDFSQEELVDSHEKEDVNLGAESHTQAENNNGEQMEIDLSDDDGNSVNVNLNQNSETKPVTSALKQADINAKFTPDLKEIDANNASVKSIPTASNNPTLSPLFNFSETTTDDDDISLKNEIYKQVLNFASISNSSTNGSNIKINSPNLVVNSKNLNPQI